MILFYLLIISGSFFLNHLMIRGVSGRELTRFDTMLLAWSFGYVFYLPLLFLIGSQRNAPDLPDGWIGVALWMALVLGLPALISGVLSGVIWQRASPCVALMIATVIIGVLPRATSLEVFFIGAPIIWNAAYAGACLPIAIEQRRADANTREFRCVCGYPSDGLPPGSPCPECGLGG